MSVWRHSRRYRVAVVHVKAGSGILAVGVSASYVRVCADALMVALWRLPQGAQARQNNSNETE